LNPARKPRVIAGSERLMRTNLLSQRRTPLWKKRSSMRRAWIRTLERTALTARRLPNSGQSIECSFVFVVGFAFQSKRCATIALIMCYRTTWRKPFPRR